MFKFIKVIALISCILFVFNSCNNNVSYGDLDKDENGSLKLIFVNAWGDREGSSETLKRILVDYEAENSPVEVINESVFGINYFTKIKTMFASKKDPDVFCFWPGLDMDDLIENGKIANLTDVLNSDKKWSNSFVDGALEYTKYKDKVYGVPFEKVYIGLFVNKVKFEKNNIKIPSTYEELKNAVKEFKKKNVDPPIAFNPSVEGMYIYQSIAAAIGGNEGISKPFGVNNENYCYIEAIKVMKELYDMGAFSKKSFTTSSAERDEKFIEQKVPMIVQSSEFNEQLGNSSDWVDFVPFPVIDKKQGAVMVYGYGSGSYYMSNTAWSDPQKRIKSVSLIKKLTSIESAEMFERNNYMFTSIKTSEKIYVPNFIKKGRDYIKDKSIQLIEMQDKNIERIIWEDVIVKKFPYVLEGRIKPEELWNQAEEIVKR